jgi:hypothetical protein
MARQADYTHMRRNLGCLVADDSVRGWNSATNADLARKEHAE